MPKATKEFVLNYATNRWQLNFKKNVGPTSDSIRECSPETLKDWIDYYYTKVRSKEHIDNLGKRLYECIENILPPEERFHPNLLSSITLDDCVEYMNSLVIKRTFDGYMKERGR